ncbi:MAG: FecR domain-containing protein [Bacteroidota bacterium]
MIVTPDLLRKFSEGKCTHEEIRQIERWLSSEKDDAVLSDEEIGDSIENIRVKLNQTISDFQPGLKVVPLYKKAMRYAAVAIILFTIGVLTYRILNDATYAGNGELAYFQDYKTIETQRGQKRTVKLPDGSMVRLNYETQIKIPEQFEENQRVVYLAGHAHFSVAHNPEKPFIVYTDHSRTQVLGTSFDLNTSKKGKGTEIIVTSGKVVFSERSDANNLVTLTVNDRAVLQADNEIKASIVDSERLTAWRKNKLIFEKATLEEIIDVLEPWFDVNIKVSRPELLSVKYRFSKNNPSLEAVLRQLGELGNFRFQIKEKEVTID